MRKFPLLDYLIVGLGIMVSGSPVFIDSDRQEVVLVLTLLLCFAYYFYKGRTVPIGRLLVVCLMYLAILIYQGFSFNFFPVATFLGFYIRILIGFFAIGYVAQAAKIYVAILCWSVAASLLFFVPQEILSFGGVSLRTIFQPFAFITGLSPDVHVFLYNFDGKGEPHRNSGYFWEPGAFAGYLILALIFLGMEKDEYRKADYKKKLIYLLVGLVSTKSTMGYLVLPLALLSHIKLAESAKKLTGQVMAVVFVAVPLMTFIGFQLASLDFIGQKVRDQYEQAMDQRDDWETNRFGNMLFDWQYIEERPYFGWGLHEKTRYALHGGEALGRLGNGLTGTVAKLGFVGLVIYIVGIYSAFKRLSGGQRLKSCFAVLALLMSMNGETFLHFPLFWGLMFLRTEFIRRPRRRINSIAVRPTLPSTV